MFPWMAKGSDAYIHSSGVKTTIPIILWISLPLHLAKECLMENNLFIYNTLSRQKELFVPINAPHVGMYVCGPTVYGDAHLGHSRPAISFDLVFRYLRHLGFKVRYVRNITDVGHLENDADEGEDIKQNEP